MDEKLDKILQTLEKQNEMLHLVMKALHLVDVTEEEERRIQLQQRNNIAQSEKILEELDKMQNIKDDIKEDPFSGINIFSDILGNDFGG
jgi:hypothetical protein